MSKQFDNKIKEALDNFEMPYDAGAWAQIEQQLPATPPSAPATSSNTLWKIAAAIAVIGSIATGVWFTGTDNPEVAEETIATESTFEQLEQTAVKPKQVEEQETKQPVSNQEPELSTEETKTTLSTDAEPQTDLAENTGDEKTNIIDVVEEKERNLEEDVKVIPTKPEQTPIIVDFIASNQTACVGQDVSFINQSKTNGSALMWDFGDGTTSANQNPSHVYVIAGTYTVTLRVNGSDKERSMTIKVNPSPSPVMNTERKLNGYQAIPLYEFTTATQPSERAIWSISDGSTIAGNNATHLFREAGEHTVKLTVTNTLGCSNSVETKISSEKFNLLAPEAFTPNGDGINEVFIPQALLEMGIAFEMNIQNPRTGQVVYRTGNALEPWNGKLNNVNQKLETGVYVWTVVLKEDVVENKVFNGKISLQP